MAAVSVLEDFTAILGLNGILHFMLNIEDKLQDSDVKIEFTGQQFSINSFFKLQLAVLWHSFKNIFLLKYFFLFNCA